MANYQCMTCGKTMELVEDAGSVAKCSQCGSLFVVPNQFPDNAAKRNIYHLATEALLNRNFDVALTYFKRILMVDAKEPAAHFGYLQSKYGVEISQAAESYQQVIFHRLEHSLFTEDPSYEKMLAYCPEEALYHYQGLSRQIEAQQRKMLRIAKQQKPFDIYINCVAQPGTADYLLANQVGLTLDRAGYRVFLPCTMLNDKPQEDKNLYEMVVAEKAQAMIVVVTAETQTNNARYLAAWKRFLSYRREDAGRKMLSVFMGMQPEQLPMELQPLQSLPYTGSDFQDQLLSKINEMFGRVSQSNDVVREILEYLRQADEKLAAGAYTEAAALYRKVRELDAEEARAHWGLVCAATNNLQNPVFSKQVDTDYQRALQFAEAGIRERYRKAMSALMVEPAWKNLMKHTGNLTEHRKAGSKDVVQAIESVQRYMPKDDPRLAKIEEYHRLVKMYREAGEICGAYKRRDTVAEPLFSEQSLAEDGYNASLRGRDYLSKALSRRSNLMAVSLALFLLGQIVMVRSHTSSGDGLGACALILFLLGVAGAAIAIFRIYSCFAEEKDWTKTPGVLLSLGLGAICLFQYFKHTEKIFMTVMLVTAILWVVLRLITALLGGNARRFYAQRKRAAQRVLAVNQQIQEAYRKRMQAHFASYGVKDPQIPEYTVRNSEDFVLLNERGGGSVNPLLQIITTVLVLAALVLGGTAISNNLYTSGWKDIISVSCGHNHVVGLREDGHVVANGSNKDGQCEVDDWTNVIQVDTGTYFTAGLRKDGRVYVAGDEKLFASVSGWRDVVQISASRDHLLALRSDGTCLAAGSNDNGECDVAELKNIALIRAVTTAEGSASILVDRDGKVYVTKKAGWEDIREVISERTGTGEGLVKVSAIYGDFGALMFTDDKGTCQGFGANNNNQLSDADDWDASQLKQMYVANFTVGLKKDGTAIFAGTDNKARAQVENWKNIVSVHGGDRHVLALGKTGLVSYAGDNSKGQCRVGDWMEIKAVHASSYTSFGIREDGTVVAVGYDYYGMTYLSPKTPLEILEFWQSIAE